MMVKNQLLKKFKVWQNSKNERSESRKENESRSIDSEVCVLPRSSFVLEPDYAEYSKEVATLVTTS